MTERLELHTTEYLRDHEKNAEAEAIKREFLEYVDALMEQNEHRLGKGSISEVHRLDVNERVCVKVTNDSKTEGTIAPRFKDETPFYNSAEIEAHFLSDLQSIRGEVGIPRPYYSIEQVGDSDGGTVSALAMETLDAVSIEDILQARAELPEMYDHHPFWEKLEKFVERMHEQHIYHRDIHEGNIMIGRKDGRPYLIDFGTAINATEYDQPYVEHSAGKRGTTRFIEDFSGINNVRKKLIKEFLTKDK